MKKKYIKPRIYVQDMMVNNFVAGACGSAGAGILNYSERDCIYADEESNMTFFSDQCDDGTGFGVNIVNPNPSSPFAQICYHRPLDELNFFSS